eukprot:8874766-Pyramimonas_sp.AAC.1
MKGETWSFQQLRGRRAGRLHNGALASAPRAVVLKRADDADDVVDDGDAGDADDGDDDGDDFGATVA